MFIRNWYSSCGHIFWLSCWKTWIAHSSGLYLLYWFLSHGRMLWNHLNTFQQSHPSRPNQPISGQARTATRKINYNMCVKSQDWSFILRIYAHILTSSKFCFCTVMVGTFNFCPRLQAILPQSLIRTRQWIKRWTQNIYSCDASFPRSGPHSKWLSQRGPQSLGKQTAEFFHWTITRFQFLPSFLFFFVLSLFHSSFFFFTST